MANADLGALYVPILPDTTQLTSQMDQVAALIRSAVRDAILGGIKDAAAILGDKA